MQKAEAEESGRTVAVDFVKRKQKVFHKLLQAFASDNELFWKTVELFF